MKKQLLKNIILFIVGLCLYISIEIFYRGISYRTMGIVAGIYAMIIGNRNDHISWDMPLVVQMLYGGTIITVMELIVGLLDKFILHINMWDYSNVPLNFMGVICVPFSCIWVLLSLIAILITDSIEYYVLHEDQQPYYRGITGKIIFQLPKRTCS